MFGVCCQKCVIGRLGSVLKCFEEDGVNDNAHVLVRCVCRLDEIGWNGLPVLTLVPSFSLCLNHCSLFSFLSTSHV